MDPVVPPPPIIFEEFTCLKVPPELMDEIWAQGWRHFGAGFFRNSLHIEKGKWLLVAPLRVRLSKFKPSGSQKRVLRRNADVNCTLEPARITDELEGMFDRHKQRFTENIPDKLSSFLGEKPGDGPCECLMLRCSLEDRTVAASFLDVGQKAASSVYGIFDPEFGRRSLGIFTMLKEIEFCGQRGLDFYYPGYATEGPSSYEYKKQFAGLEGYDWVTKEWREM